MNDFEELMKNIPMVDMNDKDFEQKFNFMIWSTDSSSDYRNDRDRPYNGQPHTDHGERGKTEIKGLTMRDVVDCMVQGFLASSCDEELLKKIASKFWRCVCKYFIKKSTI